MSGLGDSVSYNLANLKRFSGRDRRSQFWPYAATVVGLSIVGGWMVTALVMAVGIFVVFQVVQPSSIEQETQQGATFAFLFLLATAFWFFVMVGLLAAAVVRRLHDRGMRGFWALPPVVLVVTGLMGMAYFTQAFTGSFASPQPVDFSAVLILFANNSLYILTLVFLIVHLALKGTAGPNRFGDDPAA